MKRWIRLPNGDRKELADIVSGKDSDEALKYAPITIYAAIAAERIWDGNGTVTQLMNGARYNWLCRFVDWETDLDSEIAKLLGSIFHTMMEGVEVPPDWGLITEQRLEIVDGVTGKFDCLTQIGDNEYELTDYKLVGSFEITKSLALTQTGVKPKIGKDGKPEVYQKGGKWGKVGDPKMEPVYEPRPENGDMWKYEMQLNAYRVGIERTGKKVTSMKAFFPVRDGGLMSATSRGVMQRCYYVPVKKVADETIISYFKTKNEALKEYMDSGLNGPVPPECDSREAWEGRRCREYCPVAKECMEFGNTWIGDQFGRPSDDFANF